MTTMLDSRDKLGLPLKSHGYLLSIIEGYNLKAEQRQEQQHEDRLAGRTPVGGQRVSPSSPALPQLRAPHPNPDGTTSHSAKPQSAGQAAGYLPPAGEGANVKSNFESLGEGSKPRSAMPQSVKEMLKNLSTKKGVTP